MKTWRFLETESQPGFFNMALDEYLLDRYISEHSAPLLRFYKWDRPTLSLGRNQKLSEIDTEFCRENSIEIVRRPTGGKAVFHSGEFTYSFISGKKDGMPDSVLGAYEEISNALIKGLMHLQDGFIPDLGTDKSADYSLNSFCFSSSTVSDINHLGSKFIGSAQLRRGNALLQHGSILISQDFSLLKKIFFQKTDLSKFINLGDILGYTPDYQNIKNCILEGFKNYFRIEFKETELGKDEIKNLHIYFLKYKNLM